MRPPITMIPGITAHWHAIGKSMPAANDPGIERGPEDKGGRVRHLAAPRAKPPAGRP
ncbi:MAG TPA: hypothetical protein VFV84_03160 [Burkholderiales bacterium]|nr:hypothetical protein [Burkholderiales bacterium]